MSWESAAAHGGCQLLTSDRTCSVTSGVGPRAARAAAAELLEANSVDAVLSVGVAGGLHNGLRCGDVVVSGRVLRDGDDSSWDVDERLLLLTERALRAAAIDSTVVDSLTTDHILATGAEKAAAADTGAAIVQMEDSEWAEACREQGIAFAAIRTIIDVVHDDVPPVPAAWQGSRNVPVLALAVVRRPALLRQFASLALNRQRSARALERALLHVIPALVADGR